MKLAGSDDLPALAGDSFAVEVPQRKPVEITSGQASIDPIDASGDITITSPASWP